MAYITEGVVSICALSKCNISQGPEETFTASKTFEKMGHFDPALQFRYTFYRPQTKRLRACSIKYGKGGNKFGADFRIPETQMELNEIA